MFSKPFLTQFNQKKKTPGASSPLATLLSKAEHLAKYQEVVRQSLEPASREHCWLENYNNSTLYLQSDSAVWATRIRMQQHVILKRLKTTQHFNSLRALRISVRPRYQKPIQKTIAKPLSELTLAHIKQTSAEITDSKLRSALEKLGNTK